MNRQVASWCVAMLMFPAVCPGLTLVRDGQSLTVIRVAPDEAEEVRRAAEELAEILGRMSGAKIVVRTGAAMAGAEAV